MKRRLLILALAVLLVVSAFLCYRELGTWNPAGAAVGLVRVCLLDAPYARTGLLTQSYVARSEGGFDLFLSKMADWGYTHLPEEQMGSVHLFLDDAGELTRVRFLVNRYFSKWIWY